MALAAMKATKKIVVVALGSNRGDSRGILQRSFARLADLSAGGFRNSSIWKSDPVDCPPGSPSFLNAVVLFEAAESETPESLLDRLQLLEREFGRLPKTVMNEPRPLDLDIIAFGDESRNTSKLAIPHPRAHLRRFVIAPLAEIDPDFRAPGWTGCAGRLLAEMASDDSVAPG